MTTAGVGYPPRETRTILKLEGLAFAAAALYLYGTLDLSWWLFAALILAPDLAFLGFLAGAATGARIYNAVHSWVWPILFGIGGYLILRADPEATPVVLGIGLIWAIHIGVDRALGYGLRQPDEISITHLGPVGRQGHDGPLGNLWKGRRVRWPCSKFAIFMRGSTTVARFFAG